VARHLIASKGDPVVAADRIAKVVEWETQHLPIDISDCQKELTSGLVYPFGHDKENRPLVIIPSQLYKPATRNILRTAKMGLFFMDRVCQTIPDDKSKIVILIDTTGEMPTLDAEFRSAFVPLFQAVHPERIHKVRVG
jgi:hypothetical protein